MALAVQAQPAIKTDPPRTAVRIDANDMVLIIDELYLSADERAKLASDATERKLFAREIRQMLAVAEEARAAGYATRPELSLQLELSGSYVIATAYEKWRNAAAVGPQQLFTEAEVESFFKEPGVMAAFEAFLTDYQKNSSKKGAAVTDAERADLRQKYGRVMIDKKKGIAAGMDRQRKIQLAMMLQQARLLADAYAKDHLASYSASVPEIEGYLTSHPELDEAVTRTTAEEVIKRARAGADFVALAGQFSTDASTKHNGGDLGWFGRGAMIKPFEDAAFALKAGEISSVIQTSLGFHVIKLEGRRTRTDEQGNRLDEIHARHILIGYNTPDGRLPRDFARSIVERQKREQAFDKIADRRGIVIAEDFTLREQSSPASKP